MMKRYAIYVAILLVGVLLGSVLFGGENHDTAEGVTGDGPREGAMWTCSMHPQIHQVESGACPLCGMELIAADLGSSAMGPDQFSLSEDALALANIETVAVGLGMAGNGMLQLSGQIKANEKTDGVQTTIFDGRIQKLEVRAVGDYVRKGQVIGSIYAPELYAAQDKFLTSASYKDSHQKLYDAARNTLGMWKLTDEQVEEVLRTGKPIVNFPIYADVSGTVTEIMAKEGDWYQQGDPLFKTSNLYTVWAVFDAYENQLPHLKVGQTIMITSNAFPGKPREAEISFIEPLLDDTRRTVSVRATLINKNGSLKTGMFIEGAVQTENAEEQLTVPRSAVMWTGKRSLVYVKPEPQRPIFEMREVTLGNVLGDDYVILEGLAPGEEVVVNGTFTVDAAAQLQGKKSMIRSSAMDGHSPMIPIGENPMGFDGDFQNRFREMVHIYMDIKDALVATDAATAKESAGSLLTGLKNLETDMLNDNAKTHMERVSTQTKRIAETDDIEAQRAAFKPLSENMVAIASGLSDLDQPVYVQFCPMADNNKGASWLSMQDQVRNPYFGDKMLTCGKVTQTIQ